jgi:hypothetical protein
MLMFHRTREVTVEAFSSSTGSRGKRGFSRGVRGFIIVLVGVVSLMAPAGIAGAGGVWGAASELPGSGALNVGGEAQVDAVSCSSVGNCGAIGGYSTSATVTQAFVATETKGVWGSAEAVPGFAALNAGGEIGNVMTISCNSPGNCAAGGEYSDSSGSSHAFVVTETGGVWGTAVEVPGFAQLGTGGLPGALISLSCSSDGNCSGGGIYGDDSSAAQGFVVSEVGGTWGQAIEVPGLGALNAGNVASVLSVSCGSAGDCSAGGEFTDATGAVQAFVVNESAGTWGNAVELPGTAALNVGGEAFVVSVSCASSGACGLGGEYTDANKVSQSFVDDESGGTWGTAHEVTGVNTSAGGSLLNSISCTGPGGCSAGGAYDDSSSNAQAYVVDEVDGSWGSSIEVPNSSPLNAGGAATVVSVSCASAGYCSAGGFFSDGSNNSQAFVVSEVAGSWGSALEVPNTASLNAGGDASVDWISCGADGACAVGGFYEDATQSYQAFVADSTAQFTPPGRVRIHVTSPRPRTIEVTIEGTPASGGRPVTRYQYRLNGGHWKDTPGGRARRFVLSALRPGVRYRVEVRAVNELGHGDSSKAVPVTTRRD